MKWRLVIAIVLLAPMLWADRLTLKDGTVIRGRFQGFSNRQFTFQAEDGSTRSDYAVDVESLGLEVAVKAQVQTAAKQYDSVILSRVERNRVKFLKEGQAGSEPTFLLKSIEVLGPAVTTPVPVPEQADPASVDAAGLPRQVASGKAPAVRNWKRSGKWREIDDDKSIVISRGEEVDIESSLKKGTVNVVHFHCPQVMSSIRQGSYIQGIMARHPSRLVVLKVVIPDFEAPVCSAMQLKSLPQFWFYSPGGRLVKKLTDRFTESDIDAALKEAGRNW